MRYRKSISVNKRDGLELSRQLASQSMVGENNTIGFRVQI
jgi:hypothetical protein